MQTYVLPVDISILIFGPLVKVMFVFSSEQRIINFVDAMLVKPTGISGIFSWVTNG